MDKRYTYKEDITANLITRFEKMQIAPEISQDKVKELLKPQEIKKLTQQEKEVTNTTPEVQKIIEGTMKNVDWRYKRGQIKFDIKTSTLKSWNHETKIILPKD
ncbi:hypothetical protein J6T66_05985 [bacterium]|nr:hypothetical protein [bacterium]